MLHLHVSDRNGQRITTIDGKEIFHEFEGMKPLTENTLYDGNVLAILLFAMSKGEPLKVHGPLSLQMFRNLDELQKIWALWKPDKYSYIEIIPDRLINTEAKKERAISAFSGGVDATFTALSHALNQNDPKKYPLTDVLLVHGFDVELRYPQYFEELKNRITPLINDLGLKFRTIRTNSKFLNFQNWEDTFSLQLAACLHMFSDEFGYGLIGSSEPYDALILPWGSSPVTDHLLSGGAFQIVHDGAGYSRTAKIATLATHDIAKKTLKVCWEGKAQGENCGRCEKCTRTMLNFLAVGSQTPPCFPNDLDFQAIKNMKISNDAQMAELRSIVSYAKTRRTEGAWLRPLEKRISAGLTNDQKCKKFIIKILSTLGIKEHAKSAIKGIRGRT